MLPWRGLMVCLSMGAVSACGSTVLLLPPLDGARDDASAIDGGAAPDVPVTPPDDATPTSELTPSTDVIAPFDDVVITNDTFVLPDDVPTPTDDVPVGPDDVPVVFEDLPTPSDVVAVDVAPPVDSGPACGNGITDRCPSTFPGPCDGLADGTPHTVTFSGLTNGLPASCEGTQTAAGPDGIIPLTITTPSDVVITATPTGGDAVVLTLNTAATCGDRAGELRCSNSSAAGTGGVATLRASTLGPGTYAVAVSSNRGNAAIVQATITPARPRSRGDVCPGVVVAPDGPPVSLSTMGFAADADHGTTCGSNGTPSGWVDSVFSYTLTSARDVTINVSATGAGDVAVGVATTCSDRATGLAGCATGNPSRRTLRNQAPGTYFVLVEHRSAGTAGRTLVTTVTTAAPTLPGPADRCPGVALTPGVVARADVAALTPGSATLSCLAGSRADAVFGFTAPTGQDVLINVAGSDSARVGYALQAPCGGTTVLGCTGPGTNVWRRFQGLTAGQAYSIAAGTEGTAGTVSAQYLTVPAATATSVTGNESCMARRTIPATGGIFRGNSSGAPQVIAQPPCGGLGCAGGRAVYYQITLTERRRIIANTLGSGFDTLLSINEGDACPGRPVMNGCNDDTVAQASQVDVTLAAGTYFIAVQGCGFRTGGDYTLDVAVVAP